MQNEILINLNGVFETEQKLKKKTNQVFQKYTTKNEVTW